MPVYDLPLPLPLPLHQKPQRRPSRQIETEMEITDMPFAVNQDKPVPVERVIWLILASFTAVLLAALI